MLRLKFKAQSDIQDKETPLTMRDRGLSPVLQRVRRSAFYFRMRPQGWSRTHVFTYIAGRPDWWGRRPNSDLHVVDNWAWRRSFTHQDSWAACHRRKERFLDFVALVFGTSPEINQCKTLGYALSINASIYKGFKIGSAQVWHQVLAISGGEQFDRSKP